MATASNLCLLCTFLAAASIFFLLRLLLLLLLLDEELRLLLLPLLNPPSNTASVYFPVPDLVGKVIFVFFVSF